MAKISPVSIKYIIYTKFVAEGAVEKPDVIGAVFGQTEGLLGSELEMRELQKEGKIGRVEVRLNTEGGSTSGEIEIPSALDKTETAIIAAALETIERIGPSNAKIEIEKIEDVRANKRDYILDRAKKLVEQIQGTGPESREIKETVKESSRIAKIQEFGRERLPSGDLSGEEIIVVEGRADVVNLIRNSVTNVIAMNGTIIPETIKELSYEKKVTLFIDGDRGGRLIAKNVIENARIDDVAIAPDGKEVEELQGKEILICLRKRIPAHEFMKSLERNHRYEDFRRTKGYEMPLQEGKKELEEHQPSKLTEEQKSKIHVLYEEIAGKKSALLLDKDLEVTKKVSSKNISSALEKTPSQIHTIIIDGTAISAIIRAAEKAGCSHIAAKNFAFSEETNLDLISL